MAVSSVAQDFVTEILSDIFLECLSMYGLARMPRRAVPLTISHVCRHWRYVSLSTPRLWSKLGLHCDTKESILEHTLPVLQMFLRRSGSADFYIKIDYPVDGVEDGVDIWPTVWMMFHELASQSDRIKGVILKMPQTLYEKALAFSINRLPALDHLSLQCLRNGFSSRTDLDKDFWKVAARLQSLEFKSLVYFDCNPDDIETLVLKQLVFHSVSYRALFHILKYCPALESLYFNAYSFSSFVPNFPPVNTKWKFPSISSLEMVADGKTNSYLLREFITYAQLPNLRWLAVRVSDFIEPNLKAFLIASHPPLEELCLISDESPYGEQQLICSLKLLPKLKKLRIGLYHAVARALVLSDVGDNGICPLLEDITFDIKEMSSQKSAQTWTAVEDMIRSRWEEPKKRLSTTSKSKALSPTHSIVAPRNLRRINLRDVGEALRKGHQLYECITDFQRQGLVVSFRNDWREWQRVQRWLY